jgi:L-threonylcarbamoyladenylate synthase
MKTTLVRNPREAARFVMKSEIAAFPTETVYGLGANVYDEAAVRKIFSVKGRPQDNPIIVHVSSKKQIKNLAREITPTAHKIISRFFPGPITVILRKNEVIPDAVTAGLDTIAIRMPASKIAREFINACGVPIAAPSANLSGSPSPTTFMHVLEDFKGRIPCILIGPKSKYGLESTVVDCSGNIPVILRPGIITLEQMKEIDSSIKLQSRVKEIKSPGQVYRHYSPAAKMIIIDKLRVSDFPRPVKASYIGISSPAKALLNRLTMYLVCKDKADYAQKLFSFFRDCDAKGIKTIYAQRVNEKGIGLAVMNRLKKAEGG